MSRYLKKIFKGKSSPPTSPSANSGNTVPLPYEVGQPELDTQDSKHTPHLPKPSDRKLDLPQFIVGCGHSPGKMRDHNEDALFTLTTNLISDAMHLPIGLYIIADGMGGHQHGEIASGVSIRTMASVVIHKLFLDLISPEAKPPDQSLQEIMLSGALEAHNYILRKAQGGGTTLTAALLLGDQMTITHIGDSRAYFIQSDGQIQQLTQDHTLVKRLEEMGHITAEEAANHPQRNVLYRALGQGEPVEPDIATIPIPSSGYLLICSDGLWGLITDEQLSDVITTTADVQTACQVLVDRANAAGGPDNISVILVKMPD